jgi:serine protease Do
VIPETITPTMAAALGLERDWGVILSDVEPNSPAEAAGIQSGDVIVSIDGKPLRDARDLALAIFQRAPGDELHLEIQRDGIRISKAVVLHDRQNDASRLEDLAGSDAALVRRLGILAVTVDSKVLGILPSLRRNSGVAVAAVPAEYAGLNPGLIAGDVIYSLNKRRIDSLADLRSALTGKKAGDPMVFLVERFSQLIYVTASLE